MIIFRLCILRGHDSGNGGSSGNIGSPQGGRIANSQWVRLASHSLHQSVYFLTQSVSYEIVLDEYRRSNFLN